MRRWFGGLGSSRPNRCTNSSSMYMEYGSEAKHCILIPWCGWLLLLGRWCDGRRCLTMPCNDWRAWRSMLHVVCTVVVLCDWQHARSAVVAVSNVVRVLRLLRAPTCRHCGCCMDDMRELRAADFDPRPTLCFLEPNALPRHWIHDKHVGESLCGRICALGCEKRLKRPFPRSQTPIPRRWETMGVTYLYYVEGMHVGWKNGR